MDHRAAAGARCGACLLLLLRAEPLEKRIISRRTRKRITLQLEEAERVGCPELPGRYRPLVQLLKRTCHAVPLYGSDIVPYTDGRSKMEALLGEIAQARHHIHLQYYIFSDDETGCRLRDALVAKAREGVRIRILYDDVGCSRVKKEFFRGMRREGIEVHAFLHVKFRVSQARSTTATTARSPSSTAAWASWAA